MLEIPIRREGDGRVGVLTLLGDLPIGQSIIIIKNGEGILKVDQRKSRGNEGKTPGRRSYDKKK